MKRSCAFAVLACLVGSPLRAQIETAQSASASSRELTPAVAKLVDFAKAGGMRTLVYAELDDARNGPAILGMNIISQLRGPNALVSYDGEQATSFREAISDEAMASGAGGWRKILIVVDNDEVTVVRSPRPGPIEGFTARLRVEVDRVFPGHS